MNTRTLTTGLGYLMASQAAPLYSTRGRLFSAAPRNLITSHEAQGPLAGGEIARDEAVQVASLALGG